MFYNENYYGTKRTRNKYEKSWFQETRRREFIEYIINIIVEILFRLRRTLMWT